MNHPCCETCRFFDYEETLDSAGGACRRHAPKPSRDKLHADGNIMRLDVTWPYVFMQDWCGEHQPKE